ncbi:hypothetical protein TrST_g11403 [Triparma strigata]|uniref:cDENN domain-containing protein n=1 Tax=Triparma strigata TaxID=1606541 RepID=A0A9W7AS93_9STRA|nr:hypothetical protein TrST_g11403 [Triparma strigata]
MLAHRKAQSRKGNDDSNGKDELDKEAEGDKKEKERIKEMAKKRILDYRKKMREKKMKEMEEDVKKRKAIRDKYRERVKIKRLKEIDEAAAALHMKTTRSMSGYNPLTLHSPTHINSHKHTLNWGSDAHKDFDEPAPPVPPAANNEKITVSTTTEFEKVQKKFSKLYEVKTPSQTTRKSSTKGEDGGAVRGRLGSIESLTPRESRTGSELKRLSLVEITPLSSKRNSIDNADDFTVESDLNDTVMKKILNSTCFEHALVMGVSEATVRAAVEAGDWGVYDPVTLTSFPPDKPLALEALADFVFPAGVQFTKVGRKNLTSSPKFGSSSSPLDDRKVKNVQEMVLLFDTTATDYDEGDSDDDISLSDDEGENLGPRIKTSTLYGIAVTFTVTMAVKVKSSSSWSSSGVKTVMVEVPRGILLLSRNACLPVHFDALHYAANTFGWTDEPEFQLPPDPPARSESPTGKVQRGFSNFFSSQSGGARTTGSFDSQNQVEFNSGSGNPFDDAASDFGSVPSFGVGEGGQERKKDTSLFDFLTRYQDVTMPTQPNQLVEFDLSLGAGGVRKVHYRLPPAEPELNLPAPVSDTDMILEWALPVLLGLLSLEDLTMVLGCAMCEMQCVFVCDNVSQLSAAVTAVVGLLRPLKWACPIIVTLPTSLHIYLESPVPVFLGVTSLPPNHVPPGGQVLVHLGKRQKDRVQLSEEDMAKYIDHVMPGSSELAYNLNKDYMRLKGLDSPLKIEGKRGLSPPLGANVSQDVLLGMRNFARVCRDQVEWLVGNAGKEKDELLKGLGQGREAGVAFMRRLTFTQMYSAYTFDLKIEKKRAARAALNPDAYTPYNDGDDDDDESVGAGEEREVLNPKRIVRRRTTAIAMDNFNSRNSVTGDGLQSFANINKGEGSELALAPAAGDSDERDKGKEKGKETEKDTERAEKRYSSKAIKKRAAAMGVGMNFEDSHTSKKTWKDIERGRVEMLFEMILGGEVWAYQAKREKVAKNEEEGGGEEGDEEKKSDDVPKVLWCNGMCNGRVDTPNCTMLCVSIWEENEVKNMFEEGKMGTSRRKKENRAIVAEDASGGRRRGASFLLPAGTVVPDAIYNANASGKSDVPVSPERAEKRRVLGNMRMSQAGYIVKGLMQRRVEKGRRNKATGVIGNFMRKTLIARVKRDRMQRGVVKIQSYARKKKAKKAAVEETMRKIRKDVDNHLVEKLDSGRKAAKDIDWLFRETDSEIKDIAGVVKTAEQRGRTLTTEIDDEDVEWLFKDGVGVEISGGVRRRGSAGSRKGSVDSASDKDVDWLFKSTSTLKKSEVEEEEVLKKVEEVEAEVVVAKVAPKTNTPIIPIDFNKEGIIDGEFQDFDGQGLDRRRSSLEEFKEQEHEINMELEAEAKAVEETKRETVVVKRVSLEENDIENMKIEGGGEEEESSSEEEQEVSEVLREEEEDFSSEEEAEEDKGSAEILSSTEKGKLSCKVGEMAQGTAPPSDSNASSGFQQTEGDEEGVGFNVSFDDTGFGDNGFNSFSEPVKKDVNDETLQNYDTFAAPIGTDFGGFNADFDKQPKTKEDDATQQFDTTFSATFDDSAFGAIEEQQENGFPTTNDSFGNFDRGFSDETSSRGGQQETEETTVGTKARVKETPTELPALEDTDEEEVDEKIIIGDDSSVEENEEVYSSSDEEEQEKEEPAREEEEEESSSDEASITQTSEVEDDESSVEENLQAAAKTVESADFDDDFGDFGNFDAPQTSVTTSAGFNDFDDSAFSPFETEVDFKVEAPKTETTNFQSNFDAAFDDSPAFETTPFGEEGEEGKQQDEPAETKIEKEAVAIPKISGVVQRPSMLERQGTLSNVSNFPAFEDMAKEIEKEREMEKKKNKDEDSNIADDAFSPTFDDDPFETSPFPDDGNGGGGSFDDAAFDDAAFGDDDAFSPGVTTFAVTKTTPSGGVNDSTVSFPTSKPPTANFAAASAEFDDFGDDFGNFDKDPKLSSVVTFKATEEVGGDLDDQSSSGSSSSSDGFDPADLMSSPEEFDQRSATVRRSSRHETFEFDESEVDERFSSAALSFDKEDSGFDPNAKPSPRSSPPTKSKSKSPTPQPKSRRSPSSPPPPPDTTTMPSPSATQSFPSRLSKGFLLRKHSRRGQPKFTVLYSTDGQTLKWRPPSNAELSTGTLEENGKRGYKIKKSKMKMKDVTKIRTDGGTKVMKKSIKQKTLQGGQGGLMLISMVTKERTLDLEVGKEEEYECLRVGLARLCDL